MVYVLNKDGQPLMPTDRHGKVKHLLKSGKAKVVKRCPFTIRLLYESTTHTQNLTLGIDTGSGTIGAAVSKDNGDIIYMSEVIVRNDITDKMKQRAGADEPVKHVTENQDGLIVKTVLNQTDLILL